MKTVVTLVAILMVTLCVVNIAVAQTDAITKQNRYASLMRGAQSRQAFLEAILLPGDTLIVAVSQPGPRANAASTQVFKLPLTSGQKSTYYTPQLNQAKADVNKWSDSLKAVLP